MGSLKSLSAASKFGKLYSKIRNNERGRDEIVLQPNFNIFLHGPPVIVGKFKGG